MKKYLILYACLLVACSPVKYIPTETKIETVFKDSLRIKDSTVITIVPKERVVDIVPVYDTLKLSIEAAEAKSWVDTSLHCLRGQIEAKSRQESRISYKEKIQYRDTTIIKEIPVPFEVEKKIVPKWAWYSLIANFLLLLAILAVLYSLKNKIF